jgi:hypothetical protein
MCCLAHAPSSPRTGVRGGKHTMCNRPPPSRACVAFPISRSSWPQRIHHLIVKMTVYWSAEMYVTGKKINVSEFPRSVSQRLAKASARKGDMSKPTISTTYHCCLSQTHRHSCVSSCHRRIPLCPRGRCSCSRRRIEVRLCTCQRKGRIC